MDIIKALRNSGNKILESEAKDLQVWGKLKHNKQDLELFLGYNIAEINFKTKDNKDRSIICTSSTPLIKIMSLKKDSEKQGVKGLKNQGIHTNDTLSIDTWDLIDNKIKTIFLKEWQIINFISITEENVLLLDKLLREILKR